MNMNDIDHWDVTHLRAAAARERARALAELRARFAAWLRTALASAPTISAPHAKGRECFGTDC
jgi:hypothetical protein